MKLLDPMTRFDLIDIMKANFQLLEHHEAQAFVRKLIIRGQYDRATEDEIETADKLLDSLVDGDSDHTENETPCTDRDTYGAYGPRD